MIHIVMMTMMMILYTTVLQFVFANSVCSLAYRYRQHTESCRPYVPIAEYLKPFQFSIV